MAGYTYKTKKSTQGSLLISMQQCWPWPNVALLLVSADISDLSCKLAIHSNLMPGYVAQYTTMLETQHVSAHYFHVRSTPF